MKKFLFLIVMSVCIVQFANAQVIELIGIGVKNAVGDPVLLISDPGTVDHVVVEATGVFRGLIPDLYNDPAPSPIKFYESGDGTEDVTVDFILAEEDYAPFINNGVDQFWGYYTATFNNVDAQGISLNKMGLTTQIVSFTAYIYRIGGSLEILNKVDNNHVFFFRNGSSDPYSYNFTLPSSSEARDIEVLVPFSELTEDSRFVVGKLTAGAVSISFEFDSNNQGELLNLQTFMLSNVPGDVTDVSLEIYSPGSEDSPKNGDSFITGTVLLATTVKEEDPGCTLTQGYWKTHSIYGPASKPDDTWIEVGGPDANFYLSNQTWIEVFNTSVSGNSYYQLAHQYMAAYLNMLNGAMVPSEVQDALDNATSIFESKTPDNFAKVKGKTLATNEEVSQMVTLASILGSYNEGIIGPGHCGEIDEFMEKSAKIMTINELSVYPNPALNNVTVSFMPEYDGLATVDLYNSLGQKATNLFSQNVDKDVSVSFTFDGRQFNKGLYFLQIQNGLSRESVKIEISR
jgi:hypothetical protein